MKITVKCKLKPSKEQAEALNEALEKCRDAANYISQVAWERKCFSRVALHHFVYRETRSKFGLTAQLAVSVRDKVAFSYRADRSKKHIFKRLFLPLDPPRSFRLILNGGEFASISTLRGRQKITLALGEYQRSWLKDNVKNICGSEVTRNSKYFLHLTLEADELPSKRVQGYLGVDLGIINLATTSDGKQFSGKRVEKNRYRYDRLRGQLQQKGTHSAKRHLRRISGRERRFKGSVNHLISRRIVDEALNTTRGITLENLKGILQRTKVRKSQRDRHHKWSFSELTQFIIYKARLVGLPVLFVSPKYTSQRCSHCGYISKSNRRTQSEFICRSCGFSLNADHNAALNLVWVAVNQPNVLRPAWEMEGQTLVLARGS